MKRIIINLLFALTFCYGANAQTRPPQSMFNFNPSFLNPAATAMEDYGQVRLGLRRQWVGVDGAPSTAWLNGELRFRIKEEAAADATMISKGHGMGFNLYYDEIGPYATVNFNIGYAYHMPVSRGLVLSAGFAGGLYRTQFDMSKSMYPDQAVDPAAIAQSSVSTKYSPDLNAGIQLHGRNFFAGVSYMQLIASKFIDASESASKRKGQLLGSLGYVFRFNDDATSLWLSGIVKSDFTEPLRYDAIAKLRYKELFWIGSTYRKDDAWGAGLGLHVTPALSVGYLYEFGIDRHIAAYSRGSHEACIGYRFLKGDQAGVQKIGW